MHLLQVSSENMIGLQEPTKVSMIAKVLCLSWLGSQDQYARIFYFNLKGHGITQNTVATSEYVPY